jgi:FixJ family two-component response regulator
LNLWQQHGAEINLLLTDMVMPEGVSGVELAEALVAESPNLKVVYMSGYTADEINDDVLLRTHASFIQKPYGHAELSQAVRKALDNTEVVELPADIRR